MEQSDITLMEENKPEKMFVAIDIEKTGALLDDPVIAIGVVVGDASIAHVVVKRRWCLPVPADENIERKCFDEFWNDPKHPENYVVLQQIRKEVRFLTEEAGIQDFYKFLKSLEVLWPGDQITFLSDNPAYDIGSLDHLIAKYLHALPLRYTLDSQYRSITDPSEQLDVLGIRDEINAAINKKFNANHNHMPDNDAEVIYLQQIIINTIMKRLGNSIKDLTLNTLLDMTNFTTGDLSEEKNAEEDVDEHEDTSDDDDVYAQIHVPLGMSAAQIQEAIAYAKKYGIPQV